MMILNSVAVSVYKYTGEKNVLTGKWFQPNGKEKYNGHKNWCYWNVSLWINNEEGAYRYAYDLVNTYGIRKATDIFFKQVDGLITPDGARYTKGAIMAALRDMKE